MEKKTKVILGVILSCATITTIVSFATESKEERMQRLEKEARVARYEITRDEMIVQAENEISRIIKCKGELVKNKGADEAPVTCLKSGTSTGTIIPEPQRKTVEYSQLTPKELFYTTKLSDACHISQTEKQHFASNGRLATDVACGFGRAVLFAPDYLNNSMEYTAEAVNFKDTGNTLILHFTYNKTNYFWLIGHVKTGGKLKYGKNVKTGEVIGEMDLSGITTGYHSHIELWQGKSLDDGQKMSYSSSTRALTNMRQGKFKTYPQGFLFYFTHYDLGDVSQNDSAPCHGASGKNLCELEKNGVRTMAMTADVRKSYGIKFGDKVELIGDKGCTGVFQVEDEMNSRFRYGEVMRSGSPIKGDLPSSDGGKCYIVKL